MAFLDPPKDTARSAIAALQADGIAVKVLTGDNELVSRKICREVGIATDQVLLGSQVEGMSDAELAEAAGKATLFARLSPAHKQRVIKILQGAGHVVGFLGDGINDAPALRAADVGISVDTAVDIAKESADVILLEKDLLVLEEGVREGRKVFANILKYIRMGASSNFGNMFSVLGASIFLPFVPMAPLQILTNNLLYDFSQVPIPTDDVDPGTDRQAAALVDERHLPVHPVHRPVQLGLRLHHLFHHALRLRLLGPGPGVALPDRLVRRVAADADPDHPRHPHEPDSLPPELGELAADRDHGGHHARRCLVALFAHRAGVRLHPVAAALLAPPRRDVARLCCADPGGEDLALSEGLGVIVTLAQDKQTCWQTHLIGFISCHAR